MSPSPRKDDPGPQVRQQMPRAKVLADSARQPGPFVSDADSIGRAGVLDARLHDATNSTA